MSRLALRYVKAFVDRQTGAVYHYVRRRGHPLVRLPGIPGSAEFMAAYQMALAGPALPVGVKRSKPGTIAAAVAAYLTSSAFTSKAPGTQNARRAILNRFRDQHGELSITMPAKYINAVLGKKTPHAQRNWFKAIRGLFQFCVTEGMIEVDPTQSLNLPKAKSKRRRAWTEAEVEAYEAAHPIGTKHGWRSRSVCTLSSDAATSSAWGASTFVMACSRCDSKKLVQRFRCRYGRSCKPLSTRHPVGI
jgi:hypothetical protein